MAAASGPAGEFKSIRQRPRELLGNCLPPSPTRGEETVHIYEDPFPHGDGMLVDAVTDEKMFTEHVYARAEDAHDAEALVMKAFEHKTKEGEPYARGRTLIIYSDPPGDFVVARLAAAIKGKRLATAAGCAVVRRRQARLHGCRPRRRCGEAAILSRCAADDFTTWDVGQLQ